MRNTAAFPYTWDVNTVSNEPGLTKLEYVSAMCLKGLLSNSSGSISKRISQDVAEYYARDAVVLAKTLLSELIKENS